MTNTATSGADSFDSDIALFLKLALWFAEKQKMTVDKFLYWFTSYLSKADEKYFASIFPFFNKEQAAAEEILCEILKKDFRIQRKKRIVSSKISRQTDWPKTYAKAIPHIPVNYHGSENHEKLDSSLLGALVGIAEEWLKWLSRIDEYNFDKSIATRKKNLTSAVDLAKKRGVVARSTILTRQHQQKVLKHIKADKRDLFLRSINRWYGQLVSDLSPTMELIEKIIRKNFKDDGNLDNLFEATCHLSIVKAATEGSSNWKLISHTENTSSKTVYNLKREDINFRLGKGNPKNLFPSSEYAKSDKSDRMLQIRELAGQTGSGYQPDIVMGFYLDSDIEKPHVIFGDAKRYLNSDVSGAYKSTIASTMVAYGHWGKLEIKPEQDWENAFFSPVMPFFTLFHISSKSATDSYEEGCSPVREFTLQQMEEETLLEAWFNHITEQIKNVFKTD